MLRAYLVDDEVNALNLLNILLLEMGHVDVVGYSENPYVALNDIKRLMPEVVFLDIEMPGVNGMDLASQIYSIHEDIQIVFVTAHDQHAVAAFELEAVDYLLKPIEEERLSKTVNRLNRSRQRYEVKASSSTSSPQLTACMLGQFYVLNDKKEALSWRTAKEKELFALLLFHSEQGIHRDHIIHLLWEHDSFEKAKIYLHTCVSYLRANLKKIGMEKIILYTNGNYVLDWSRIQCDYQQLVSHLKQMNSSVVKQENLHNLESMMSLYTGPLLSACDYPWAVMERERIEKQIEDIQINLIECYYDAGDVWKAIQLAERLVQSKTYHEIVYNLLIKGYQQLRKHDEANRVKGLLEEMLRELNLEHLS